MLWLHSQRLHRVLEDSPPFCRALTQNEPCTLLNSLQTPCVEYHILNSVGKRKQDTITDGMRGFQAGFMLALMMDRCLFVDFPFFNKYFDHELDFSWKRHAKRLLAHGHNATAPENIAERIPFGYVTIADVWMFKNMTEFFNKHYGVEMWKDLDWSAALLVNNPHHQVSNALPLSTSVGVCYSTAQL